MRKLKLIFALPVLAFLACSEDPVSDQIETAIETQTVNFKDDITEVAFPNDFGAVTDVYYTGLKLPVENVNGKYIYQGDIIIPKSKATKNPVDLIYEKGKAPQTKSVGRTSAYWTDNTVYYDIDGSLPDKNRVYDAISHWEANTNL